MNYYKQNILQIANNNNEEDILDSTGQKTDIFS